MEIKLFESKGLKQCIIRSRLESKRNEARGE